jgi:4-hydroxy-tetrahydrodipicolinate reductase
MKIIISGYGKMGRLIERHAIGKGHTVAAVIDPQADGSGGDTGVSGTSVYKSMEDFERQAGLAGLDTEAVALDFTHPSAAERNIRAFAEIGIPLVIGTTGWVDRLDGIAAFVERCGSALLWSSNFSIGVNLFYRAAAYCAALLAPYGEYDAAGYEAHHRQKADSPSGTAKRLAELVLDNMSRKTAVVWEKLDRPPAACELHFASLRVGAVPGTHALVFDSPADSIELKHTVRNRDGLVSGAVAAAEWLHAAVKAGKRGVFTMDDVLGTGNVQDAGGSRPSA